MAPTEPAPTDPQAPSVDDTPVLGALSEERARIGRILARLHVTDDLVERADLGSELVRSASRYEDTVERAVLPALPASAELDRQSGMRAELRAAMTRIQKRTQGMAPRNVHASDAQGFEDNLTLVMDQLRALLDAEDAHFRAAVDGLTTDARHHLRDEVTKAFESASERPQPPRTGIGRMIGNAHVKLDHAFEDVSTSEHPGEDTING